jgi:glycosyltransferase involved in cell wall biosynthesis
MTNMSELLVSVVVCNYNYERFLEDALSSVTAQTRRCELVVVDDGSTDGSREILSHWADRAKIVLQDNAGQVGAYNRGFLESSGDIVIFLDSDDLLDADTVERVLAAFEAGVAKVHWPMRLVGESGSALGGEIPYRLGQGEVSRAFVKHGILYASSPGSGNAYRRDALQRLFPLPEDSVDRHGADFFTIYGAPLFGEVRALHRAAGSYRVHERGGAAALNLVFGNAAKIHVDPQRMRKRVARFRQWIAIRTSGEILPPDTFLDFSVEKLAFARAIFEARGYWPGLRRGIPALVALMRALWLKSEFSIIKKLMLSAWSITVLLAPRGVGFPVARYVCNPASRS